MTLASTLAGYQAWRTTLDTHYVGGLDGFEDRTTVERWRTWLREVALEEERFRKELEFHPDAFEDWVRDSDAPYMEANRGIADLTAWLRVRRFV